MKDEIKNVEEVRFTHKLKDHPVCLSSEGEISTEMEKVLNSMPNNQNVKAKMILEINVRKISSHLFFSVYRQFY